MSTGALEPMGIDSTARAFEVGRGKMLAAFVAMLHGFIALLHAADPGIRNLRVAQVSGRAEVEILYDFEGDEGTRSWVEVAVSEDGGKTFETPREILRGDFGGGVERGPGQRVVWCAGERWLGRGGSRTNVRVDVGILAPVADMVWIAAGAFRMGSPQNEKQRSSDEGPTTEVRLPQGFFLGMYQVTQGEWEAVMGSNPSYFNGDAKLPVEQVSWGEAMEYCRRLTERERRSGRLPERGWEYRLPTEAQWEYACRAGTMTATAFGDRLSSNQANFDGNYPSGGGANGPYLQKTVRVGSYAPNAWRLYDMHGNVWEWCLDLYEGRLPGGSVVDPAGSKSGSCHVLRGGSWFNYGQYCRSAARYGYHPGDRNRHLGFRPALVAVP